MIRPNPARAVLPLLLAVMLATTSLTACGDSSAQGEGHSVEDGHSHAEGDDGHGHSAEDGHSEKDEGHSEGDAHGHEHGEEEEGEKGPKGGRLLRDGDFALEVALLEGADGAQFRVYAYEGDTPVAPAEVGVSLAVTRLGGETEQFTFAPQGDFLAGNAPVEEPHSFDVAVRASHDGTEHSWTYESYEGRTTIASEAAAKSGVKVAAAGAATIRETADLSGRAALKPNGRAEVKAWYPGRITALKVNIGDRVKKGQPIATIEARDSLKAYSIPAPIGGVVMERQLNVGDVAEQQAIVVIGDPTALQAELHVFPRDAERVRAGQSVELRSLNGGLTATSVIDTFVPTTEASTQTLTARATLPNPDETWRAGMAIEGSVTVATSEVPVAVKLSALQRMGENTVVFVAAGDIYEARPVTLGRQDSEMAEITSGLTPGQVYVTDNAFLIRADIEKSGAAHEH